MVKISRFDAADYLKTPEDMIGFLDEAAADPDPRVFPHAMQTVWRAMRRAHMVDSDLETKRGKIPA